MGGDFRLNGIKDDISWITTTSVEDVLKQQASGIAKVRKAIACLGIFENKGERVRQVVCGTVEDHGMRLVRSVNR